MYSSSSTSETTPSPIWPQRKLAADNKGKQPVRCAAPSSTPMERLVQPMRTVREPDTYILPNPYQPGPSFVPSQPHPQPPPHAYMHRPLTVLDAMAPPDPYGPYARTPSPGTQAQPQLPAPMPHMPPASHHFMPAQTEPTSQPFAKSYDPMNLVAAGPLPGLANWSMPSDPINKQHGPQVPDGLLGRIDAVDYVEDMNAPFPFQFAQERACGSMSPVFVSQNGYMHYYAWGNYQNVAMLTMTVPVHRLQQLRLHLDSQPLGQQATSDLQAKTPPVLRENVAVAPGAPRKRKRKSRAKPKADHAHEIA